MSNYFENADWKAQRLGKFTSSEIWKLLKSGRKKEEVFGQTAMTYIQETIAEILTGEAPDTPNVKAIEWGHANEVDAIRSFQEIYPEEIEHFGGANPKFFAFNAFSGGSPDGLSYTLVVEAKCPWNSAHHVQFLIASRSQNHDAWLLENWEDYYAQVQFNMLCCNRRYAALISYDPRVLNHEHRLAVLYISENPEFQSAIVSRLEMAKKIVIDTLGLIEGSISESKRVVA